MPSSKHSFQPIERLKWEHAKIIEEVDRLCVTARDDSYHSSEMGAKITAVFKFLELHQEAEERFLLPLVSRLDDGTFDGIRREHLDFLRSSDALLAKVSLGTPGTRKDLLTVLGEDLERHFMIEEKSVFDGSAKILSRAQMDILRIKLASRKDVEL